MVVLKQEHKIEGKKKMLIAGIPEHILNNSQLNDAIKILPAHYNFEIYKTLLRIETLTA
jgi:2-(3-amino-3-carboxypropyl)histidine synthase